MKTITVSLSDDEFAALEELAGCLDPSGSVKVTSVAKGCMMEGLVRSAKRLDSGLPLSWLSTEAMKRYLVQVR